MRLVLPLPLLLSLAAAAPAVAQVAPYPGYGPGVTTGDVHRYEMDRLRNQADQRDALARQQALDTRLTVLELQARRIQPPPSYALQPLRTVEQERAARETATARREATARGVGQIDAWLDRAPQ